MKVLEKGRDQCGWAQELRCAVVGGCGAKLLVEEDDVYYIRSTDYGGGTDTVYYFVCCECGCTNTLGSYADVPRNVRAFEAWKTFHDERRKIHVRNCSMALAGNETMVYVALTMPKASWQELQQRFGLKVPRPV